VIVTVRRRQFGLLHAGALYGLLFGLCWVAGQEIVLTLITGQ
jgi:hypothetical protein